MSGAVTHPPAHARVQLQGLALLRGRRPIATSAATPVLVGAAVVPCHPAAAPPDLPAPAGWIAGGVYLEGGPAPGIDQCQRTPSTVTATSGSGSVVASQALEGCGGYALVVPAGAYQLRDGACRGQATVIAGRRTVADTDCSIP